VITVIDARWIGNGSNAIVGDVASGGGPVDLFLTADGNTLLVPNYEPKTLTLIPISHLP
jgi:hypothetical protein